MARSPDFEAELLAKLFPVLDRWIYDGDPVVDGIYAIRYGWDADEGWFADAGLRNNGRWSHDFPPYSNATVVSWAGPFTGDDVGDNWKRAEAWAHEHDPDA